MLKKCRIRKERHRVSKITNNEFTLIEKNHCEAET